MSSRIPVQLPLQVWVRVLLAVLLGGLLGVGLAVGIAVFDPPAKASLDAAAPGAHAGPAAEAPTSSARASPRDILREWDAARARAWTDGDVAALLRLYTPGSVAGRRDAAMLRAWNERGARITELSTQVLELTVRAEGERRLVLEVTDRVARATARSAGSDVDAEGVTLPSDEASTRRLVLRRSGAGAWQMASVVNRAG